MRKVGVLAASLIFIWCTFSYAPKTHAASSGVVVATVQIRQPLPNSQHTTKKIFLNNISLISLFSFLNVASNINIPNYSNIWLSGQIKNYSLKYV
jgi:hypothetical protein